MAFFLDDHDKQMFADLLRHHLRHPGSVSARIVNLFRLAIVNPDQIAAVRLEWLKLGYGAKK